MWGPTFAERKGYIYSSTGKMGGNIERLAYLDNNGELTLLFDGEYFEPYATVANEDDRYKINGSPVSQSTYEEASAEIYDWMNDGTYDWSGEWTEFASGKAEAISKLRSGE